MLSLDFMNILGIAVIFAMPYMSGYIIRTVLNRRETGQIETYLMGFFFVFLMQWMVFYTGGKYFGMDFVKMCRAYVVCEIVTASLFILALVFNICRGILRRGKSTGERYRQKLRKEEWAELAIILLIIAFIIYRIFDIKDYIRDDYMLPTVKSILNTGQINVLNPITHRPYVLGLIPLRKIITLPVYYAAMCSVYGFDVPQLLYIIMTIQTVICTYLACILFIIPVVKIKERVFIYSIFLGGMILSGDYFNRAIGGMLLWNGYAGSTITATVMLPYTLYVIYTDYRNGRTGAFSIFRLIMVMAASITVTGMATGALLIAIVIITASVVCLILRRGASDIDRADLIVEE